jgi:hypothetical protein
MKNGAQVLAADVSIDLQDQTMVRGVVVAKSGGLFIVWRVYAANVVNPEFFAEAGASHERMLDAFVTYDYRRGFKTD